MAVHRVLSKKGKTILIISIIVGILIIGGSGYLLWRINQEEKLSSEETEAGANVPGGGGGNYCCRFKCCDGSWRAVNCTSDASKAGTALCTGVNKNSSCGSSGYSNCAGITVTKCSCEKWNDSCGTNCTFPSGTQEKVTAAAASSCSAKIAMCNISTGAVTIETYSSSHGCYGKVKQCNNPFAENPCKETNVCDTGAWTKEIPSTVEKGQSIDIAGYGKDSDGVDPTSVSIAVDGETVDNVTAVVNPIDTTKTNWSYTLTGLEKGEHTVTITWKDTKGLGGSNCTLTDTFTVTETVITNPDWQITKTGSPVCSEGATDDLDTVQVTYAITITNKGNGEGTLEKIVDTLDQKMQESFLVQGSLSNGGTYSGGVITWNLSGDNAVFDPGESKTYQYNLSMPRTSFGTYGNTVAATPTEGDSFSAVASIQADCTVIEDIPQTGIFDDASRKILIGFGFLALGMLYMKFDFVQLAWNGAKDGKRKIFRSTEKNKIKRMFSLRERFEKKIVKSK